jgi:hypothetical protein
VCWVANNNILQVRHGVVIVRIAGAQSGLAETEWFIHEVQAHLSHGGKGSLRSCEGGEC